MFCKIASLTKILSTTWRIERLCYYFCFQLKGDIMEMIMKIVAVIPARYNSSRLPRKPLADICGKPMIW